METQIVTRDEVVKPLRPVLTLGESVSEIEAFQNKILRPILKFQNELLIAAAKHYCHKQNKAFNALKVTAQKLFLKQAAKQDQELRSLMINLVVALFTIDEFRQYVENRPEYNKRIVQMATERVLSQIESLI